MHKKPVILSVKNK